MSNVNLLDIKKHYKKLPHQEIAIAFLGEVLLRTPAGTKLELKDTKGWVNLSEEKLSWLQLQLDDTATLVKFTQLWRANSLTTRIANNVEPKIFSQRDNSVLPYTTCASSTSAAYCDLMLRRNGKQGLNSDEGYLGRVFSGKYGKYAQNNSVSWDVQTAVLNSYGVKSNYKWNKDFNGLKKEVDKNGASVINIYHKGSDARSRGGGHIVMVTGFTSDNRALILDPYGERPPHYKLTQVGAAEGNNYSSEQDILQRLILCEARGEGLLGLALVARVVLNRVNLTLFKIENFGSSLATVKGIVYARNQFEPTWSKNNNMSDIYARCSKEDKRLAVEAIALAQDIPLFRKKLLDRGLPIDTANKLLRSTFFAAKTHPHAILPYVNGTITVNNQLFGVGKRTEKTAEITIHSPYNLSSGHLDFTDLIGKYWMTEEEFSWRWQGCYRLLSH